MGSVSGGKRAILGGSRLKVRRTLWGSMHESRGQSKNRKMVTLGVGTLIGSQSRPYWVRCKSSRRPELLQEIVFSDIKTPWSCLQSILQSTGFLLTIFTEIFSSVSEKKNYRKRYIDPQTPLGHDALHTFAHTISSAWNGLISLICLRNCLSSHSLLN